MFAECWMVVGQIHRDEVVWSYRCPDTHTHTHNTHTLTHTATGQTVVEGVSYTAVTRLTSLQ